MKRYAKSLLRAALALMLLALAAHGGAQLPPSKGAPKVGEKAPEFTLPDSSGKPVRLSELLGSPAPDATRSASRANGPAQSRASYVLLIFYRGYW